MYLFIVSSHVILLKQSSRNTACSTHQAVGTNSLLYCHYTREQQGISSIMVQFSSVPQSCPTLCNPMDCSTPGLHIHHQLLEVFQTHVHWVGDVWRLHWLLHSEEVLFKRVFHQWCYVLNSWLLETALPENSYKAHITWCCIPKNAFSRTSLVVQWLRLWAPKAEGWGLIPALGN